MLNHFQKVRNSHAESADVRTGISHSLEKGVQLCGALKAFRSSLIWACRFRLHIPQQFVRNHTARQAVTIHQLCRAQRKHVDIAYNGYIPKTKQLHYLEQLLTLARVKAQLRNYEL